MLPPPPSSAAIRAIAALAAILVLAQVGQPFPETAWLHHLPTLALILASPWLLARWPLSDGAVVAVVLFLALHTLGGRHTYSSVPYDEWAQALTGTTLSEAFGWSRNHYDRLVHFAFGLLLYAPARELLGRRGLSAIGFVLAAGAVYEIFEWLLAVGMAPEIADDYNGQQGDPWDAQKDMALAFAGSLMAAAWYFGRGRWRRR